MNSKFEQLAQYYKDHPGKMDKDYRRAAKTIFEIMADQKVKDEAVDVMASNGYDATKVAILSALRFVSVKLFPEDADKVATALVCLQIAGYDCAEKVGDGLSEFADLINKTEAEVVSDLKRFDLLLGSENTRQH